MAELDLVIRGGTVYDGAGGEPRAGDVGIAGGRVVEVGEVAARGRRELRADGLAVAPGFVNMLSWSVESLIADGRSQSEIRQGVTLEVMGEGVSMGPLTDAMKATLEERGIHRGPVRYEVEWTGFGEYLEWLERRGVAPNIASFVGSATVREHVMGRADREATGAEIAAMCALVGQAMAEGAMGLSAAIVYPPATYQTTDELVALAAAAGERGGLYISHIRSEGETFLEAIDEFVEIATRANVAAEVYHLKVCGAANWHKLDRGLAALEKARSDGRRITADVYPYTFAGTGLDSCIPPWAHEDGFPALRTRLSDPATRERIRAEMTVASPDWENLWVETGAGSIVLAGLRNPALRELAGKSIAEVAALRGVAPEDAVMDLLVEDDSPVFALYDSMSEDNLRTVLSLPWVSVCSDAESQAPEGVFLESRPHPRAYGAFARVLGRYVRDEGVLSLEEAIRRMTSLPAATLGLDRRGQLRPGFHADVAVFDPQAVRDNATAADPHRYASGMVHVLVNGESVLEDGEHTGATPGRVVRGPGWRGI